MSFNNLGSLDLMVERIEMSLSYGVIGILGITAVVGVGYGIKKVKDNIKAARLDQISQTEAAFAREAIEQPTTYPPTSTEATLNINDMRIIEEIMAATALAAVNMPDSAASFDLAGNSKPIPTTEEHPEIQ